MIETTVDRGSGLTPMQYATMRADLVSRGHDVSGLDKAMGPDFNLEAVQQARARIKALSRDEMWRDRFQRGGVDERAEWEKLNRILASGKPE